MYRLIYKSEGIGPIDWSVVEGIMHSSEANNRKNDIRGALLATEAHFLQVIEGKFEDVNNLFRYIYHDKRHINIQLIAFHPIDARLFDGWSMKGIGVFDFNKDIELKLVEKYGLESSGVRFPLEEWQVLAMVQDISIYLKVPEWKR
jgi:hypothetical protein